MKQWRHAFADMQGACREHGSMTRSKESRFAAIALAALVIAQHARADGALLTVEASAGKAVTAPQDDRFGFGGAGAIAGFLRFAPWLLGGVRLRAGALANGAPPPDPALVDPGTGTFEMLSAVVRLRPFASGAAPRSAPGLFVEAGAGGTITGTLVRPSAEAGLGYGIAAGSIAIAPVLHFVQVIELSNRIAPQDARVLMLGVELALIDTHRVAAMVTPTPIIAQAPSDQDGDGVLDTDDACPELAEDRDGFQDDDGCPERDNDHDKIADADDDCPNEPEDYDGFEDADGCPDPDNDHDGVLDADDKCPLEAEVINGVKDEDGCPDTGLIEMHDDRIVLEEEVLFDFESARVKHAAYPVLDAIFRLYKQHPEWMKIRIEGHADQRGKEEFNRELSEWRANNVMKQLVERGIPAEMIESAGFGSSQPRDKRDEEQAYRRNRRVEFVVVARRGAGHGAAAAAGPASPPGAPQTAAPPVPPVAPATGAPR
jgi:outer membrane protein OmpA-like peptidoglycan-associated protein